MPTFSLLVFLPVPLPSTKNFPLDRIFQIQIFGEAENSKEKMHFFLKIFKKGIDFMEMTRYNAYLYEYVWEQEV